MTDHRTLPLICLDFDGVVHSYTSGWQGATVIPDSPVPGLWEFLVEATAHFRVAVFSSRSHEHGGIDAMKAWLLKHAAEAGASLPGEQAMRLAAAVAVLQFPLFKPSATVSLDDRALTFTGVWPSVETLRTFEPWYRKAPDAASVAP